MIFTSPGAILFQLGPFAIRWYGLMIAIGCLAAFAVAAKLAKRFEVDVERVINCAFCCFISGVVGARLYFVALSWNYFKDHLNEIPATWLGGLSIHGGLIAATICGALYCRKVKLPLLPMCDLLAVGMPLAQAIGRWGNFFNSELFGLPVSDNFLLKLFIPLANRPLIYKDNSYFHPTFLYESILDLLLFCGLYFYVIKKAKAFPGLTFMVYLAGYSIIRMLIEPLRIDSIAYVQGIQAPIIASAIYLIASIIGMVLIVRRKLQTKAQSKL